MIHYPTIVRSPVVLDGASGSLLERGQAITATIPECDGVVLSTWLGFNATRMASWPLVTAVDGVPALMPAPGGRASTALEERIWLPLGSNAVGQTIVTILSGSIRISDLPKAEVIQVVASHLPDLSNVLFVSPHPDDTEISASGLVRRVHEAGGTATLVCVTPGEGGPKIFPAYRRRIRFRINLPRQIRGPFLPSDFVAKGKLRHQEQLKAASRMGIPCNRVHLLGYPDTRLEMMRLESPSIVAGQKSEARDASPFPGNYRAMQGGAAAPYEWTALVSDLSRIVADCRPTTIVLPAPADLRVDSHPDHPVVHQAMIEALKKVDGMSKKVDGMSKVDLVMYTNHADGHRWPHGGGSQGLTSGLPVECLEREPFLSAWLPRLPGSFPPKAKRALIRLFADAAKTGFDLRHARIDELFFVGVWTAEG